MRSTAFARSILCTALALAFSAGPVGARTWYIKPDGSGDAPSIQGAIHLASNGDTVLVAAGWYTGASNKNIDYLEKTLVVRSEDGPFQTIIDCQGEGRGFQFINATSSASKLEGLTIVNGQVAGGDGGGISCRNSSPAIANCILRDNWAEGRGGGIHCDMSSSPIITRCLLVGNSSYYGGGICCVNNSSPSINGCVVTEDSAHTGGGIHLNGGSSYISDCLIVNNKAHLGAGIEIVNASPTLSRSSIVGNRAGIFGGGVDCINSTPILGGTYLNRNSIYHNTANQGGDNLRTLSPVNEARYVFWGRVGNSEEDSLAIRESMDFPIGTPVNWWPISIEPRNIRQKVTSPSDTLYFPEVRIVIEPISMAVGDSNVTVTAWPDSMPPGVGVHRPIKKWFDVVVGPAIDQFSAHLRLDYTQSELDSSDINDEQGLYCARYDQGQWAVLPGQVDMENNRVECSTSQLSVWAIGGPGGPLTIVPPDAADQQLPARCQLFQNCPNPFNASTEIEFAMDREGPVCLQVFNVRGQLVRTLVADSLPPGRHRLVWDGTDAHGRKAASGLYLCRLAVGEVRQTRKMMLLR